MRRSVRDRARFCAVAAAICAAGLVACVRREAPLPPLVPLLRVAVPRDSPPYAFWRDGRFVGLELDLARALARTLGRPLEIVEVAHRDLVAAVSGGSADVVMGGMPVARSVPGLTFTEPYLRSGLVAVVRYEDAERHPTADAAFAITGNIAVAAGTAARFVHEHADAADIVVCPAPRDAIQALTERRVDVVVHEAASSLWLVAQDPGLVAIPELLDDEPVGWAVRSDDDRLRADLDGALAGFRADGTLDRIVARWLPYWPRLMRRPPP